MISINNKFLLSDDVCERIKSEYKDKVTLVKTDIRQPRMKTLCYLMKSKN